MNNTFYLTSNFLIFSLAFGGIGWLGVSFKDFEKNGSPLYQKVSVKADIDGDGVTTHREWTEVYRKLGIHFDVYTSSPKDDLTTSQLEKYLTQFPNK